MSDSRSTDDPESEDAQGSPGDIIEDESPRQGLGHALRPAPGQEKEDQTRQVLAYGIVGALAFFYVLLVLGVIFGCLEPDDMVTIAGATSGFQTLAAAVAGFYFARSKE